MEAARSPWPALGVLLIRDGLVSRDELEEVLSAQGDGRDGRISSQRLGEALVERGLVTGAQVARLVAEQHELPFVDLDEPDASVPDAARLDESIARRHNALPIRVFPDGSLLVVVDDPTRAGCFEDLRRALGAPLRFAVAAPAAIEAAIADTYAETHALAEDPDEAETESTKAETASVEALPPPAAPEPMGWPILGSLLLREGLVTELELETALAQQRLSSTRRLGEILVARGTLTETQVAQALAMQHELPFVDLRDLEIDDETASRLPPDLAHRHCALPFSTHSDGSLTVAVADPTSVLHSDELRAALGVPLRFAVAVEADIRAALASTASRQARDGDNVAPRPVLAPAPVDMEPDPVAELRAKPAPPAHSPVMDEIEHALSLGASTIHLSPTPTGLVIRGRVDGVVSELAAIPATTEDLAGLRLRGRFALDIGDEKAELRSTSFPTPYGDRVTLRVVPGDEDAAVSLSELVEDADTSETVRKALEQAAGLLVICSPPGEGRTTTLHAAIAELNTPERVLLTVEDPIHRLVGGVDQAEIDPQAGVTFASGLRAVIRSDPDVVAVDELRDAESARLALRAARAGALALCALEAETASSGIRWLLDLGLESSALSDALAGVVAQRLLRRACLTCRDSYFATAEDIAALGRPAEEAGRRLLGRGRGCEDCARTGYRGTSAIFEAVPLDAEVRGLVARAAPAREIERAAIASGMRTLHKAAVLLCLEGVTTSAEVARLAPVETG